MEGQSKEKSRTWVFPTRSIARLPGNGIYFSGVFDKAEPQSHHRWIGLRNSLGLPHVITVAAIQQVMELAKAELGALALIGGSAQNTGLPMTDNQRNKLLHQKAAEQKSLQRRQLRPHQGRMLQHNRNQSLW